MEKTIICINEIKIAILKSKELLITDTQSALDLIAAIDYYDGCSRIVLSKDAVVEDFFKLSTGIAGEVLQKFINYSKKLAIVGDFSVYSSKPLQSFIYESNNGNSIFFAADEKEAIERLSAAI